MTEEQAAIIERMRQEHPELFYTKEEADHIRRVGRRYKTVAEIIESAKRSALPKAHRGQQ